MWEPRQGNALLPPEEDPHKGGMEQQFIGITEYIHKCERRVWEKDAIIKDWETKFDDALRIARAEHWKQLKQRVVLWTTVLVLLGIMLGYLLCRWLTKI